MNQATHAWKLRTVLAFMLLTPAFISVLFVLAALFVSLFVHNTTVGALLEHAGTGYKYLLTLLAQTCVAYLIPSALTGAVYVIVVARSRPLRRPARLCIAAAIGAVCAGLSSYVLLSLVPGAAAYPALVVSAATGAAAVSAVAAGVVALIFPTPAMLNSGQ